MSEICDYQIHLIQALDNSSCEGNPDINYRYPTFHSSHPVTPSNGGCVWCQSSEDQYANKSYRGILIT